MDSGTAAPAVRGHTKQYVFVDEYNRHKRLKVMRACDGCRKRKIRCDGALQNGPWPCGACVRLKLKCVPPTLDPNDENQASATTFQGQYQFHTHVLDSNNSASQLDMPASHPHRVQEWAAGVTGPTSRTASTSSGQDVNPNFYSSQYYQNWGARLAPGYQYDEYLDTERASASQFRALPNLVRAQTEASESSGGDPQEVDATVKELSGHMGDLAITMTSGAPYIANEKKNLAEIPAIEEAEVVLPASVGTDSTVRIPPEMMPSDERALDYFGYFFSYIHPYVPVLNRHAFYTQWRTARHSISPLILEGIFACVAQYLEDPIEVRRWLQLASKHEESFKDVPRLSTVQAMILLTKAREFLPRRGYYYRSWMTIKYMITMAFDLGLHEHNDQHELGPSCRLSGADCTVRTRLWQTLYGLEIMVGASQGRTELSIQPETVSYDIPMPSPDMDVFEYQTSRRMTIQSQDYRNIRETNRLWLDIRRYKKDWALDPAFVRHGEVFGEWLKQLPADLQVHYPEDDSPPWLGNDHFLAFLHSYHNLAIIMHHRPQLQARLESKDPNFTHDLENCLESASMICRLQEALYRDYGLHGLQFMQRGINFTIYCVLTCTMIHLVAITSPDTAFNSRARKYFTRHMRVLEHCLSTATPDLQAQINALREAFSQDTSRPFELKPGLGLRSPALSDEPTPPELQSATASAPPPGSLGWPQVADTASSKTVNPSTEYGLPFERGPAHGVSSQPPVSYQSTAYHAPSHANYGAPPIQQVTSAPQIGYPLEPVSSDEQHTPVWDPSGIFQQWNTAFGQPQVSPQQSSSPQDPRMPQTSPQHVQQQMSPTSHPGVYHPQQLPTPVTPSVPDPAPVVPTVTPVMWQNAFTTAYVSGHGNKRYRQDENVGYDQYAKRRG